jgi:hypothetical protein
MLRVAGYLLLVQDFRLNFGDPVKSLQKRHPGENRGPEIIRIGGFRLSPE